MASVNAELANQDVASDSSNNSENVVDTLKKVRQLAAGIVGSPIFEKVSLAFIAMNCIALGFIDPCDQSCQSNRCRFLRFTEIIFFLFFAIEMIMKMLAMGVFGRNAYLSDSWNRLDFVIVVAGAIEIAFANSDVSLLPIRALRVLKPLRAINRVPGLRVLVNLLIDIMPMLGNVLIICFFIFFLFGTIAVQLWSGIMRQRCFFAQNTSAPEFMPRYYFHPDFDYVCSRTDSYGMFHCSDIGKIEEDTSICSSLFESDGEKFDECKRWVFNYTECRAEAPNPKKNTMSFDNIGYASIAIFQVISLEGWSEVMYHVQDSFSFWAWTYFFCIVILGAHLTVNLCLVIIAAQFSVTKLREKENILRSTTLKRQSVISMSLSNTGSSTMEGASIYYQLVNLAVYYVRKLCRSAKGQLCNTQRRQYREQNTEATNNVSRKFLILCPNCSKSPANSYRPMDKYAKQVTFQPQSWSQRRRCQLCGTSLEATNSNSTAETERTAAERYAFNATEAWRDFYFWIVGLLEQWRPWVKKFIDSKLATLFIMLSVIINAVIIACEHHNQSVELTRLIEISNHVFTVIFTIELVAKLFSYRFVDFIRDIFNALDFLIVTVSLIELFLQNENAPSLTALRLFRLVRIVKLVRFLPVLRHHLLIMVYTIDNVATFFVLLTLFLYISALLGMSLFGCRFCLPKTSEFPRQLPKTAKTAFDKSNCFYAVKPLLIESSGNVSSEEPAKVELQCPEAHFDNLGGAMFTVLQIFTQDNWGDIMQSAMIATGDWASVYFIALVTFGNYIMFNLLVAILVEGFNTRSEKDAILKGNMLTSPVAQQSLDQSGLSVVAVEPIRRHSYRNYLARRCRRYFEATRRVSANLWRGDESSSIDFALFSIPSNHIIRVFLNNIFASPYYNKVMRVAVVVNCAVIALENPHIKDNLRTALKTINCAIDIFFITECAAKILAVGLIFGKRAYLRTPWNCIDFFLALIAITSVYLEFSDHSKLNREMLQLLIVLRVLRALRPLRMIGQAKGLRTVISTLAISIVPIGNVLLICFFFYVIFAILGVQLFRGCFSFCAPSDQALLLQLENLTQSLATVTDKQNCEANEHLVWRTRPYNFDSMPEALMALFVFSTLDGWADIARNGAACVEVDKQPIPNYNYWGYFYFISFLLLVCFFALNMFVGVVVDNFQKVRRQETQTGLEQRYLPASRRASTVVVKEGLKAPKNSFVSSASLNCAIPVNFEESELLYWLAYPRWRRRVYLFVNHKFFELFMVAATAISVALLAAEYYNMPEVVHFVLETCGFVFLTILVFETITKLVAFGARKYWRNAWNKIDAFVLFSSLAGAGIEALQSELIPINPSVIRIARIFRILRIVKLWRSAKGVRRLIATITQSVPHVCSLFVLFFLLFFIYSSLAVELYGRMECRHIECRIINRHTNFENFGNSMLTLFRVFTGDEWNGILRDVLEMSDNEMICEQLQRSDGINCQVIHMVSPPYFVSFVLLSQIIMVNVVVAVLMAQIEDLHKVERPTNSETRSLDSSQSDRSELIEMMMTRRGSNSQVDVDVDLVCQDNFVESVDFATLARVRFEVEHCSEEYLIKQLQKLANSDYSEGSGGDDEEEEELAKMLATYRLPELDNIDISATAVPSSNYEIINETVQIMDCQLLRRLSTTSAMAVANGGVVAPPDSPSFHIAKGMAKLISLPMEKLRKKTSMT